MTDVSSWKKDHSWRSHERIERKFKHFMLSISSLGIPDYLSDNLLVENKISFNDIYLSHYRKLIGYNWMQPEFAVFRQIFKSKQAFNESFKEINGIRNTVFHPSKQEISKYQKQRLAEFYLLIMNISVS